MTSSVSDFEFVTTTALGQRPNSPLLKAFEYAWIRNVEDIFYLSDQCIALFKYPDVSPSGTATNAELVIGYQQLIRCFREFVHKKGAEGKPIHRDWHNLFDRAEFREFHVATMQVEPFWDDVEDARIMLDKKIIDGDTIHFNLPNRCGQTELESKTGIHKDPLDGELLRLSSRIIVSEQDNEEDDAQVEPTTSDDIGDLDEDVIQTEHLVSSGSTSGPTSGPTSGFFVTKQVSLVPADDDDRALECKMGIHTVPPAGENRDEGPSNRNQSLWKRDRFNVADEWIAADDPVDTSVSTSDVILTCVIQTSGPTFGPTSGPSSGPTSSGPNPGHPSGPTSGPSCGPTSDPPSGPTSSPTSGPSS